MKTLKKVIIIVLTAVMLTSALCCLHLPQSATPPVSRCSAGYRKLSSSLLRPSPPQQMPRLRGCRHFSGHA